MTEWNLGISFDTPVDSKFRKAYHNSVHIQMIRINFLVGCMDELTWVPALYIDANCEE